MVRLWLKSNSQSLFSGSPTLVWRFILLKRRGLGAPEDRPVCEPQRTATIRMAGLTIRLVNGPWNQ
jgi:hypothetical protein